MTVGSIFDEVSLNLTVAMTRDKVDAVPVLEQIGAQIGYGRAIQVLQAAWRAKALADGFPVATADQMCGLVCTWCGVDTRTGKRIKQRKAKP